MPWHRSPSLTEICKENPSQADDCIRLHAPSSEGCGARSHQVDAWGSAEHPKALGYLRASAPCMLPPPRTAAEGLPLPEPRKIILLSFTDSFQPSQARRGCKGGGTAEYREQIPVTCSPRNFPPLRLQRLPPEWGRCQGS